MRTNDWTAERCPIARGAEVLGDRWSVLILREAFRGRSRFAEFRDRLGVASDVLSDRLGRLVDAGVLQRVAYRDAGSRERHRYVLTAAGDEAIAVLGAFAGWADEHRSTPAGVSRLFVDSETGEAVTPRFVTEDGRVVGADRVAIREITAA